jgi:hypothetical protein
MPRTRITADDEARAIRSIRIVRGDPDHGRLWTSWTARQRMMFVIGMLLDLPACCPLHRTASAQFMRGFLPTDVDTDRDAIRRRALEILTAVALVDQAPGAAPIDPRNHLAN